MSVNSKNEYPKHGRLYLIHSNTIKTQTHVRNVSFMLSQYSVNFKFTGFHSVI